MCGRLNVTDDPAVQALFKTLGLPLWPEPILPQRFVKAASDVPIIFQKGEQRYCEPATWWLLLERTESTFKPSKYTSFNTRYDKLNIPRTAGYQPFRESRCIIPVKGFGETEFKNKKPVHYYDMEALDGEIITLGGLYREWFHPDTGEIKLSCSVITLPPHPKLQHIHSKAMPLILPQRIDLLNKWLAPTFSNTQDFDYLLQPHLPQSLSAYPIDKPSTFNRIGDRELIHADAVA